MAKSELSKAELLEKAEAYCARAEHCATEVRRKLFQWTTETEKYDENGDFSVLADSVIAQLYAEGFLNDNRFCHAYVHDKTTYQLWGRMKIRAGLQALHLPETEIIEALEDIDEDIYTKNIVKLLVQRRNDSEEKRLRFMLQRGFSFEEIKKCMKILHI